VDEVLIDHPAVAQVVTFAVPDAKLGEDVGAAVVLYENASATEGEIQAFAAAKLADFKVPRQVVFLDEIPKGATGKLQRIGLAERLGLTASDQAEPDVKAEFIAPRTPIEEKLAEIWSQVLGVERVGVHDNFLQLGGDSILAAQIISRVRKAMRAELSFLIFISTPTVASMAKSIEAERHTNRPRAQASPKSQSSLVPIQPGGTKQPFFLVPGGGGGESEFFAYAQLIHLLGSDQPVYGLLARGSDGEQPPHTDVETMAANYLQEIRTLQPKAPYLLGGECVGGKIAFEMARQLQAQGQQVALLVLMNTELPSNRNSSYSNLRRRAIDVLRVNSIRYHWLQLQQLAPRQRLRYILDRVRIVIPLMLPLTHEQRVARHIRRVRTYYNNTLRLYTPRESYTGQITLLVSEEHYQNNPSMGWDEWAAGDLETYKLPGDHYSFFRSETRPPTRGDCASGR
jgi:thioesterase domain-containing protein/aryl carrier-like protein